MGWELSAVTMEEVLGLVPGFVDILVLAGGRTSYGTAATWRSGDVQKALRWALFFEEVFRNLRDTGQYEDSAREFDAALVELTSSPDFPKGLADMRSGTLAMARVLVLKHFLKAKTMSVENLRALLEAVVEMDVDGIGGCGGHHAFQEYVNSILNMNLSSLMRMENAGVVGAPTGSDRLYSKSIFMGHSRILVKELLERLDSALCISLADRGLSTLQNGGKKNSFGDAGSMSCALAIPKKSQMIDKLLLWKQWRGQCLSYLLDERTIRIVSGSSFIFSAPKEQWMKVFEPLKGSVDSCQSGLTEVMELCLLGLVSRRWDPLIGSFMSHTFNSLPISKQYTDLHQLLPGISQDEYQDRLLSSKEKDILEYAWQSIESKPHLLWLLPPVLTAAAIPPWSTLFKIYLAEIDKQFDEASSTNRKCNCRRDGIEQHHNCEIAERIQCLYTLHVEQPHLTLR
ncbi:uncharacterized protein LOC100826137 isoform X2 [Brachypodium distachyon]|uniref:Uncharacterized protein n=1 Tax=Brachypodium distachyon TaxID=15368 RepID=A0A0Q3MAH3_BRADI|nr:uncharacterized protein LOC100826137 isoform X2 [Brachypodium distachyon]KQK01318.1 hypothetical protein BRADI_3g55130v3 [Brachypodium distachyon]|eukprot:XP_003570377.1 uncharacterized protein LOC100826137 isoform X2 [Brachypodium distachyon]